MDPYQTQPGQPLPASQPQADASQYAPVDALSPGAPGIAPPMMPPTPQSPALVAHVTPVLSPDTTPTVAEDVDLIEKEWVEKAKAIVEKTRNDPYAQNQELNRFKADYMQKRYNKEIKIEP